MFTVARILPAVTVHELLGEDWDGRLPPEGSRHPVAHAVPPAGGVADGIDDGQGGQQPRDDRQTDGGADPDQADQAECEQGTGDGAQIVHRPLEPIRPPIDGGGDDVGQQGVAGRDAQPARGPGAGPEHGDLPDTGGGADKAGEHRGGGVAADGLGAAAAWVVGDGPTGQPGHAGQPVRDALDEAEGGSGGAQGRSQQVGQQGSGDLVADVGQEASRADAGYARPEPALLGFGGGVAHGGSLVQRGDQSPFEEDGADLRVCSGSSSYAPVPRSMVAAACWAASSLNQPTSTSRRRRPTTVRIAGAGPE